MKPPIDSRTNQERDYFLQWPEKEMYKAASAKTNKSIA